MEDAIEELKERVKDLENELEKGKMKIDWKLFIGYVVGALVMYIVMRNHGCSL